jgi:predicted lipoprotein with Yx(FWY)xxD motif
MKRRDEPRAWRWPASLGRIAAIAVALGGLSAVAVAPSVAGAATNTTATEISTAKTKVGTVLVAGDTPVYTLKGSKTCNASCQKSQPPVLLPDGVTSPTAGTGVDAAKLGTTAAANGAMQITYAGKPLYWSAKDKSSSAVRGSGKNKFGTWSAVVLSKSSSSGSTSTTSGNGGVGF